jgi:hypothetical protein
VFTGTNSQKVLRDDCALANNLSAVDTTDKRTQSNVETNMGLSVLPGGGTKRGAEKCGI